MRFTVSPIVKALALGAGIVAATNVAAVRMEKTADSPEMITPAWLPLGMDRTDATVVLQLGGDPVAVVQGNAGRQLTKQEKDAIKERLKSSQASLHDSIESLGGTVVRSYQTAYNGIKVTIARDKLARLAARRSGAESCARFGRLLLPLAGPQVLQVVSGLSSVESTQARRQRLSRLVEGTTTSGDSAGLLGATVPSRLGETRPGPR